MNETRTHSLSIAVDKETPEERETPSIPAYEDSERKVRTFRMLQRDDDMAGQAVWVELGTYETPWTPDAKEVGAQNGEGDYLLIESTDTGSPEWAYGMRVVADRVYRLADDETAP